MHEVNCISLKDELPPRKGKLAESLKSLKWSRWITLKTLDLGKVPPDAGVYQMRWAVNDGPSSINRLDGVDEDGLLYIGKAKNLKTRLKALHRGIIRGRPTHTAVYTYMWDNFDRKFKPEQLEVRWAITPEEEIDDYEFALLGDYVEAYLDTPPLNISRGRK
jgi:hypothetical protein